MLKYLCLIVFININLSVIAADNTNADKSSIDKKEIRKTLESMKSSGKINNVEYMNSLKDLDNLNEKELEAIRNKAANVLESDPKAMQLLMEDPVKAQKYIEEKLKK